MGYMVDHTIVVSDSGYGDAIDLAHAEAVRLDMHPSEIVHAHVNGVRAFFCPPDGSKAGWEESEDGDERRGALIRFMEDRRYGDGSSPLGWVEVQFHDEEHRTAIIDSSDHPRWRAGTETAEDEPTIEPASAPTEGSE